METEQFDIIDPSGKKIGKATREKCHNGSFLLHGVVHVLVFNRAGQLYLQKRSNTKVIQPGKWDTSIGGHINSGETLENALERETEEELGISRGLINQTPTFKKMYSYIMDSDVERELVTTFYCIWDGPVHFQKEEIDEIRLFTPEKIENLLGTGFFTPNFEEEWEYYKEWVDNK